MKIYRKAAFLLGSAFMCLATTLSAQEQPWSLGVKSGVNMHWVAGLGAKTFGTNESSQKMLSNISYTGGITAGYAFHENVGMGIELLFVELGGKSTETIAASNNEGEEQAAPAPAKFNMVVRNVAVPVMIQAFPMGYDSEEGILDIQLGAQFELPISAFVKKVSETDATELEKDGAFQKEFLRSFNVSGIVGLGYEFPNTGLKIESRYSLGLLNILRSADEATNYAIANGIAKDQKLTNQAIHISLGYNLSSLLWS